MKNSLSGKQILITGGAGYLANNLLKLLADIECKVIRLDRPGTTFEMVSHPQTENVTADIREPDVWEQILKNVDVVFHFAAQTSVYVAMENPMADFQINVLPMLRMIEVCRRQVWKPIILFSGTATEVGLTSKWPVDETAYEDPVSIYDIHKLSAEKYLKHYVREGFVYGAVLRLANVYGPGPRSSSGDRGVLNLMMRKAIQGEPLIIYGDGCFVRDYVFVEDVAQAFVHTAINIGNANGKHYLVGSGQGHTLAEAINLVADRAALKIGRRPQVLHVEPPRTISSIESRNFVANTARLTEATGWRPRVDLVLGIDRTLDYFLHKRMETT